MNLKERLDHMYDEWNDWGGAVGNMIKMIVSHTQKIAGLNQLFAGALSLLYEQYGEIIHIEPEYYSRVQSGSRFMFTITIQPTEDGGCDIIFTRKEAPEEDENEDEE